MCAPTPLVGTKIVLSHHHLARFLVADFNHIDAHGVYVDGCFYAAFVDNAAHNVIDESILVIATFNHYLAAVIAHSQMLFLCLWPVSPLRRHGTRSVLRTHRADRMSTASVTAVHALVARIEIHAPRAARVSPIYRRRQVAAARSCGAEPRAILVAGSG